MDKINTQGVAFTTTNYTTPTPFQPVELTCFTKMEREEIKQMMREVMNEYIQHNRYDVIERIRDDYHHGGYDEYE